MDGRVQLDMDAQGLAVKQLVRRYGYSVIILVLLAVVLAICTAAYGALAGPLLRALFGGDALRWPAVLASVLPAPPSIDALQSVMPWLIVGVALLKGACQYGHTLVSTALGATLERDLRTHVFRHCTRLAPDVVARLGTPELLSRTGYDVEQVSRMMTDGLVFGVRDVLQVICLIALCVIIDWRLTLVVFVIYPIGFWPVVVIGRKLRYQSSRAQGIRAKLLAACHDQLRRLSLFQLSGAQAYGTRRFEEANEGRRVAETKAGRIWAMSSPFTEILGAFALAAGVVYTIQRLDSSQLAPELVMSFIATVLFLYQPIKNLSRIQAVIEPGRAAIERINDLLLVTEYCPEHGGERPPKAPPEIRFENVSRLRGSRWVVRSSSWCARAGEITALVGPNGSGKTTMAWLLARMLEPDDGRILVDGRDLAQYDSRQWRGRIGWVTQHALLGPSSIKENVTLGAPSLNDRDISALAAQLGLMKVIEKQPGGWAQELGEEGSGLSGGEQQRVALLRALVRTPLVLILDEPTAHLDAASTQNFVRLMSSLRSRCTVLLITHDDEVARVADVQYQMDNVNAVMRH
ncbi:MAG: ABC transporter ATP-binding protein [Myxococcota bacterium]|nr:ABC transporter ATP-binding protein [Myxococcota bacterium]